MESANSRAKKLCAEPVRAARDMLRLEQRVRSLGVALSLALLTGCASAPLSTFDLTTPQAQSKARALRGVLVVPEPVAPPPVDGDRIVVRTDASAIAVVKGAQWADRLPRLLQTRLIQTFENAKMLRSVSRPGDGITVDHSLAWEIRRFEVDASEGVARVEVSVKLLDTSGRVLGAQIFFATAPGSAGEGAAATLALDTASKVVLRQIVDWASARV